MVCGSPDGVLGDSGSWIFNGKSVDRVSEYKYVGVMVNEGGTWDSHGRFLKEKAISKTREIQYFLGRHWDISARVKVEVWRSLVLSVMKYGSEVWYLNKVPARDLEAVQLGMLKSVLRINRSTTDEFVRGEVGRLELERERDISMLVWMGRILKMGTGRWARRVWSVEWQVIKKGSRSWKWKAQDLVAKYGLLNELRRMEDGTLEGSWKAAVK